MHSKEHEDGNLDNLLNVMDEDQQTADSLLLSFVEDDFDDESKMDSSKIENGESNQEENKVVEMSNNSNKVDLENKNKNPSEDENLKLLKEMETMKKKIMLLENQLKRNNTEQEKPLEDENFKSFTQLQTNHFKITPPTTTKLKSSKISKTPSSKTTPPPISQTSLTKNQQVLSPQNSQTSKKQPSTSQNPPKKSSSSKKIPKNPPPSQNKPNTSPTSSFSQALTTKPTQKQPATEEEEVLFERPFDPWPSIDGEDKEELSEEGKELQQLIERRNNNNNNNSFNNKNRHNNSNNIHKTVNQNNSKSQSVSKNNYESSTQKLEKELSAINRKEKQSKDMRNAIGLPKDSKITWSYDNGDDVCDGGDVTVEEFSGIRIVNPLISGERLRGLMEQRKMVRVCGVEKMTSYQGDWVTIGVVVSKSDVRTSVKGEKYEIWKLNDLRQLESVVSVMLFGRVLEGVGVVKRGSVVGILNPSFMKNKDNKQTDVTLSIDNAKKVLLIGRSKDLGICRGSTKAGHPCNNFINMSHGNHCSFHVQKAYKKMAAKRGELQNGFSGVIPRLKKQLKDRSFNNDYIHTIKAAQPKVTLDGLLHHYGNKTDPSERDRIQRMSTLKVCDVVPADDHLPSHPPPSHPPNKNLEVFHDLLSIPSAGSINYVKHLKNSQKEKETEETIKKGIKIASSSTSAAKDLLNRSKSQQPTNSTQPLLGRGLKQNGFVDLGCTRKEREMLAKVKSMGGFKKQDPNSLKKPGLAGRVAKRLREEAPNEEHQPTPPKKSLKHLINATSAHAHLVTEEEKKREGMYFEVAERTEQMEQKMINTTELSLYAFTCLQCKYTHTKASDLCKKEGHTITRHKATKKFFECCSCGWRTQSFDRRPNHACSNCGHESFKRTGMMKEKCKAKLHNEKLVVGCEEAMLYPNDS